MPVSASLRTRFAATFALSIMIGAAVLSVVIGARSSQEVRGSIGQSLAEVAFHMADKLDRGMWARSGEVALLASLAGEQDLPAIRRAVDQLRRAIPVFSWIGFTDPHGRVLAASDGILEGMDISKRPVYLHGINGTFVGDVHDAVLLAKALPNPSGEPMQFVDISTPIKDGRGEVRGVLAAHLSWAWARELRDSVLTPVEASKDIEVFVVANDNTVLLGPAQWLGKTLSLDALGRARAGGPGWVVERWGDDGEYLTGYALGRGYQSYAGLGWTVLARQPAKRAYEPVARLQRDVMLGGGAVALMFALAGWWVAGRVSAPLRRIAQVADRLRGGEAVEIPNHRGIRDIEVLTASLKALIASLTQSEAARCRAEDQANRDRLTGLANRLALETHLDRATASARRTGASLAVLCLDLDGFKGVNDTLGHHAGDLLLHEVGLRLRGCARGNDLVARLGGDEFVLVLSAADGKPLEDGVAVGERIIAALGRPFDLDGTEARIGCSVGVAVWPEHDEDVHQVMRLADRALYAAKRAGKNRVTAHAAVHVLEA